MNRHAEAETAAQIGCYDFKSILEKPMEGLFCVVDTALDNVSPTQLEGLSSYIVDTRN
jgi:hypothetical protein